MATDVRWVPKSFFPCYGSALLTSPYVACCSTPSPPIETSFFFPSRAHAPADRPEDLRLNDLSQNGYGRFFFSRGVVFPLWVPFPRVLDTSRVHAEMLNICAHSLEGTWTHAPSFFSRRGVAFLAQTNGHAHAHAHAHAPCTRTHARTHARMRLPMPPLTHPRPQPYIHTSRHTYLHVVVHT
jgi:hypothetical protein